MNEVGYMLKKHSLSLRKLARYLHTSHTAIARRQKQKATLPFVWRVTLDLLDDYLDDIIPRWMSTYVIKYFEDKKYQKRAKKKKT